jgi:hypothetical protein
MIWNVENVGWTRRRRGFDEKDMNKNSRRELHKQALQSVKATGFKKI